MTFIKVNLSIRGKLCLVLSGILVAGLATQPVHAATAPIAPSIIQKSPLGSSFIDIMFAPPPSDSGDPITGYDVWTSSDSGKTFSGKFNAPVTNPTASPVYLRVPETAAVARLIKVRAHTAQLNGDWSSPVTMFTTGARAMRVYVQAPDGTPITGGAITWNMPDTPVHGAAHSSVTYGLTIDGYVDLPSAPAGEATFTLTKGELPNGVLVSGQFGATLGFDSTVLQTVRPPTALHVVNVAMPNGLPISNVHVVVNSSDMTDTQSRQGFTFTLPDSSLLPATPDNGPIVSPSPSPTPSVTAEPTPTDDSNYDDSDTNDYSSDVIDESNYDDSYFDTDSYDYWWVDWYYSYFNRHHLDKINSPVFTTPTSPLSAIEGDVVASGLTNTMGRFVVKGFTNTVPTATISYDDGVISQSQSVQLTGVITNVELPYAPFISAISSQITTTANTPAIVPIVVADTSPTNSQMRYLSSAKKIESKGVAAKVRFSINSPAGVKNKGCAKVQKFSTGANGKVKARVCANVSGQYTLKSLTAGYVSLGSFSILVRGGKSLAVQRLKGKSMAPGKLAISWVKPRYAGGKAITKYKVTLKPSAGPVIVKYVTRTSISVSGLAHAKRYTVTVNAVTTAGAGTPISILSSVV